MITAAGRLSGGIATWEIHGPRQLYVWWYPPVDQNRVWEIRGKLEVAGTSSFATCQELVNGPRREAALIWPRRRLQVEDRLAALAEELNWWDTLEGYQEQARWEVGQ